MRRLQQTSSLPCSPEEFWETFLDARYVRALFLDGLGFRAFDVIEVTSTSRKLRIVPKMNLPGVLEKIVGDAFAYEEHGTLDRAKNEWTWRMVRPSSSPLPELVATRGTVQLEPADGRATRFEELVIEGKLFGLGGVIESAAEREARAAWARELPFLTRWLSPKR